MVIPKPLCRCRVCEEAREKGVPYERSGPSAFIHDEHLLIDTPAEIASQLNRCRIDRIEYLMLTHLDPDHIEGLRILEQVTLDFRTWRAYPEKSIRLIIPEPLHHRLRDIRSAHGNLIDFYEKQGFVQCTPFEERITLGDLEVTAVSVDRGNQVAFIYVYERFGKRMVYAPCDIKPFPEHRQEVQQPDLLVIQPGIFEDGLKHAFAYPRDHVSRTTLYTFEQTVDLARRIGARKTLFVHLEEYWNRSHDDYLSLETEFDNIRFAYDGMYTKI
jgi:phosphoribosyl 1,2-cyclic phosphate phosphodiesterase